jgi:hypothetical protein
VVIDLGLQRHPGRAEPKPPVGRPWWRPTVAACGLLLVPALATTAAPERPGVYAGAVFDGRGERFAVVADQLLIAESDTAWAVYDLPGGRHRWGLPADFADLAPKPAGAGLLVSDRGEVRDAATGDLFWSGPQPEVLPGEAIGLVDSDDRPLVGAGVEYGGHGYLLPHRAAAVELAGGRELWSIRADGGMWTDLVGGAPDPLVVVRDPDGTVEIRDLAAGRVLARERLFTGDAAFGVRVVGLIDGVLVLDSSWGAPVLQGYALPTLRRLWTRPYALDLVAEPCAGMVCLRRDTIGRPPHTEVVSPATGRLMWSTEAGRVESAGGLLFLYDGGSGYLGAVVAADTGRAVRGLYGWRVVPTSPPGGRHATLVGLGGGGYGTLVARLDLATLAVSIIGSLPHRVGNCHGFTGGMVCYDATRRIGIWRFGG